MTHEKNFLAHAKKISRRKKRRYLSINSADQKFVGSVLSKVISEQKCCGLYFSQAELATLDCGPPPSNPASPKKAGYATDKG